MWKSGKGRGGILRSARLLNISWGVVAFFLPPPNIWKVKKEKGKVISPGDSLCIPQKIQFAKSPILDLLLLCCVPGNPKYCFICPEMILFYIHYRMKIYGMFQFFLHFCKHPYIEIKTSDWILMGITEHLGNQKDEMIEVLHIN